MQTATQAPVSFTPGAVDEIRKLMAAPGFDKSQVLRVGVKGGGCSGLSYVLAFDKKEESDKFFEYENIACAINPAHEMYLYGMEIDWQDGLNNRGFVFRNPNASTTCGCGSSFGV